MISYIVRRLLLMIPTLIGITLLLFLLVALAPGGLTASALASTGGGAPQGEDPRVSEARFRDRFSLDQPVLVQYFKWLSRVSPVKFGQRAQIDSTGARIYPPRALPEPIGIEWLGEAAVSGAAAAPAASEASGAAAAPVAGVTGGPLVLAAEGQPRRQQYVQLTREYDEARSLYVAALAKLRIAFAAYAIEIGREDAVASTGEIKPGSVASLRRDASRPTYAAIQKEAATFRQAQDRASRALAQLQEAFESTPYPEAGVPIIPGLLSVGLPDMGWSRARNLPVTTLVASALPVTLLLNIVALPVIYLVAIPTGMLAAARRGRFFDVVSGGFFVALWSVPVVLAGVLAIGYLADKQHLGLFPVATLHDTAASSYYFLPRWNAAGFQRGYLLDTLWHMVLPVACLTYAGFAVLSRQTRAAMLDNFSADYVRTATAKGVPRRTVVLRHVFRNSLLPIITIFVSIFPAMLSGSVVVEKIFTVPGMGTLILDAVSLRDADLMLANATMIGFVNLLALLLADLLYAAADPRVTYG